MAINLQLAHEMIRREPAQAEELVDDVRAELGEALQTLRDLARGIYPPALAEHGIVSAVEAHLIRLRPVPTLESNPATLGLRYSPQVEAAAFFCVLEALQNCAKHAPGSAVRVCVNANPEQLTFSIADDGPGFDPSIKNAASGLQGMVDRLAVVGGRLTVQSAPGEGTTISGVVQVSPGRGNPLVKSSKVSSW